MTAFEGAWGRLLRWRGNPAARDEPPAGLAPRELQLWHSYADYLTLDRASPVVLAHLGASLDGRIATESGHSSWVTGQADLTHMHRLRALSEAVLVGPGTVAHDDPQLTVRLVPGPSPVRIVLDPRGTLAGGSRVFAATAPGTLWLRGDGGCDPLPGSLTRIVRLPAANGRFAARDVLAVVREHGIRRLMIEGGGRTVSAFIASGLVDILHYCVAPVVIGSGRSAFALPVIATMQQALRLEAEVIPLGADRLYVCRLARGGGGTG